MKYAYSRALEFIVLAGAAGLLAATSACAQSSPGAPATASATYVAHLTPLNSSVTGTHTTGEARFVVKGNQLIVSVHVTGASPNMTHWQHIHGFKNGQPATCATQSDDANGDGIVDLIETGKASGTTMVPLDTKPATMDVAHGHYPKTNADGSYSYREVVSLNKLQAVFGKAFPGQKLNLVNRVVYVHGVPADTKLPSSVASLGPIPAQVTLPIACGKIERVK